MKVMICFDYERDLWRANRVLNAWQSPEHWDVSGYADAEVWENIRLRGTYGVNRWITGELDGTVATIILVGSQTSRQPHVLHAIQESLRIGNGLLLLDINNIRDQDLKLAPRGPNPLEALPSAPPAGGRFLHFDWVEGDGPRNMDGWLKRLARRD